MNIGPVRFAIPIALFALIVVPVLAGVAWYEVRRRAAAHVRYGGSPTLRIGVAPARRALQSVLLVAAVTLLILAVAQPQWGTRAGEAEQRGIDVAIVLDVSRSMLATDVQPSRARASAQGIRDMLTHLDGNRVALVTFAGSAFTRSPLTVDLPAIANLVERAQGDSPLVQAGTDLRLAIDTALGLLAVNDRANTQAIVLVSDGEDLGADVQASIERANAQGIAIYTVFAGTENATALPPESGGTDATRGDPRTLATIARGTGGETREVRGMAGLAVDFRRMRLTQFETAETRVPHDRFAWLIGGALVLLLAQAVIPTVGRVRGLPRLRRARPVAVGIAALAMMLLITSCIGGSAAYRHVEAGNRLYSSGQFERALAEYQSAAALDATDLGIQYNIANALYRLGRFEEASTTIEAALAATPEATLSTKLHYSGGNTAVQRNDLERALAAFRQALRQDATDEDAKANLEFVLRRTAPPPPPEQQPGQGQGQPTPGGTQPGHPGQDGQQPGQQGQSPGQSGQQPGQRRQPGTGADGNPLQPPGTSTRPGSQPGGSAAELKAANDALDAALAQLGPEVTPEEATNILALAQRANDLSGLAPRGPRGDVPAR